MILLSRAWGLQGAGQDMSCTSLCFLAVTKTEAFLVVKTNYRERKAASISSLWKWPCCHGHAQHITAIVLVDQYFVNIINSSESRCIYMTKAFCCETHTVILVNSTIYNHFVFCVCCILLDMEIQVTCYTRCLGQVHAISELFIKSREGVSINVKWTPQMYYSIYVTLYVIDGGYSGQVSHPHPCEDHNNQTSDKQIKESLVQSLTDNCGIITSYCSSSYTCLLQLLHFQSIKRLNLNPARIGVLNCFWLRLTFAWVCCMPKFVMIPYKQKKYTWAFWIDVIEWCENL